jgi:hypothetical protein
MSSPTTPEWVAFLGQHQLAIGSPAAVARAAKTAMEQDATQSLLIFGAHDSRPIDLDLHGSIDEVLARLTTDVPAAASTARGPGRPKLGVVAREVTLLPRHWDWLGSQPGGASAVLRHLVEQASRKPDGKRRVHQAMESADRFMRVMAGDLPGYEEASRALYRGERNTFDALVDRWPVDIRLRLRELATQAWPPPR